MSMSCEAPLPRDSHSTPTQARNALRYVLQNGKKHGLVPRSSIDHCSSAPVFDGWKERPSIAAIAASTSTSCRTPSSLDALARTPPTQAADARAEEGRPAPARASNPVSLDVVLASTSARPHEHEFRSPRLPRAPKRRTTSIDEAEPRPQAQQAT
jgi:hypothetical protein